MGIEPSQRSHERDAPLKPRTPTINVQAGGLNIIEVFRKKTEKTRKTRIQEVEYTLVEIKKLFRFLAAIKKAYALTQGDIINTALA